MDKLKMPEKLDTDKKIVQSGSGSIRLKSRWFAYAAAALMLCVAVGAIVFYLKGSDSTPKIGSSVNMTLESDDTIPSEEINSVEQAAEQYRKCMLLENDEYIKLKANKNNITKDMAQSFTERIKKMREREILCIDYIANKHSEKTLFVCAAKYDNGVIDLSFHLDSRSQEWFEKLYEQGYGYYICRADSGEKLLRCRTEYRASPNDIGVRPESEKLSPSDLEKLSGKLSFVLIGKNEWEDRTTVIEQFEFFDKVFISGEERAQLKQLAAKAMDKQDSEQDEKNESYPIDLKLMDFRADAHGIVVKLTAKPNGEQGAELIRKYSTKDETGHCELMLGSESCDELNPIYITDSNGKFYTTATQHCFVKTSSIEKGEEYIDYICYIPLKDTPPEDHPFDIYLKAKSGDMTDEDTQNGKWKNVTVGKITVKYNRNAEEKIYTSPSGRKIYLSDLYFTVPVYSDTSEFTLKYTDGTTKSISAKDLWVDHTAAKIDNPFDSSTVAVTTSDDNISANFFKDAITTGDVTSVIYAGEEYKLAANTSEYPIKITADKVVCSQHGMYMRLTLTAANDKGKEYLKKSFRGAQDDESMIYLGSGDPSGVPQPDVNLGRSVTGAGWEKKLVTSEEQKLVYDCYLPITKALDIDFGLNIYALVTDPSITSEEIANGEWKGSKIGSIKVKYENPMKERVFTCGNKKILLSDICLAVTDSANDVTELTLKKSDGTQETLKEIDFSQGSIQLLGESQAGSENLHKCLTPIAVYDDDVRVNFITKTVDTSKVTSIIYAGEEYKLAKAN